MSPRMSVGGTWLARAKINLSLRVVGRRPPGDAKAGYHELDSLVVFAETGDRIRVAPAQALSLDLQGPFAGPLRGAPDNLVLRAARALARTLERPAEAAIFLEKNLPVASGIGGGSADAAATLRALVALWGAKIGEAGLAELGLTLGADLPVCLAGRPSLVRGIGERLEPPGELPPAWLLLANPGDSLATPAVFAERKGAFSDPLDPPIDGFADAEALARFVTAAGNDLTAAASRLCPALPPLLERLAGLEGALAAALSGSGATCFALFAKAAAAAAAEAQARRDGLAPWIVAAPLAQAGQGA
ncbi:MAG: 4-(cytidine 5'-diphospho)-2-C-methyl-D-erythritol kinase [Rhodospirillales bacterium]